MSIKAGNSVVIATGSLLLTQPVPITLDTERGRILIDFERKGGAGFDDDFLIFGADYSGSSGPQNSGVNDINMVRLVEPLFGGSLVRVSYTVTAPESTS
jgi:hypothetical protein